MMKRGGPFELVAVVEAVFCTSALLGCSSRLRRSQVGRVVGPPFHFFLALIAALMGVLDTCVGTQYSVWTIAKVSRGQEGSGELRPV